MPHKSEDTEGCIFNLDYSNYSLSLNKDSLNKIKDGEKIKTKIYHDSYLFKSKKDLQERMRKELILGLLTENNNSEKEIIIEPYGNESKKVIIEISKDLLENLINFQGDNYEYCLNSRGNKINFYVNNNPKKEYLDERINSLEKKFSKKTQN